MEWTDLWAYYKSHSRDVQKDILRQLDFKSWLQHEAGPVQLKILDNAPKDVIKSLQFLLDRKAQLKLGLSVNSEMMRRIFK